MAGSANAAAFVAAQHELLARLEQFAETQAFKRLLNSASVLSMSRRTCGWPSGYFTRPFAPTNCRWTSRCGRAASELSSSSWCGLRPAWSVELGTPACVSSGNHARGALPKGRAPMPGRRAVLRNGELEEGARTTPPPRQLALSANGRRPGQSQYRAA